MDSKDGTVNGMQGRFIRHLDPDRIRTNAEIRLFADVFSITFAEARRILTKAENHAKRRRNGGLN